MDRPSPGRTALRHLQDAWRARGPLAYALLPVAALFGVLAALRRVLYRRGWRRTEALPASVVVVGNLVAGGAGKTPAVIAIVDALRRHGYTPGVVSRGYGRRAGGVVEVRPGTPVAQCGDEPLLTRLRTAAPVVVGHDRAAAARHLLERHSDIDVVVADDGLQHLRLARDAQVLVFDERGAGNGWLLPAGPLRESLPRAVPPRSLVLYNAASSTTPLPGTLATRSLAGVVVLRDWWQGEPASMAALESLRDRAVLAVAGLAQPDRFFEMLSAHGLSIAPMTLPDHHGYETLPWPADTADVVLTEKDAIKLDPARVGNTRVWVAPLNFGFDAAFETALVALLPPPRARHGH